MNKSSEKTQEYAEIMSEYMDSFLVELKQLEKESELE